MKKILIVPTALTILTCVPLSAQSWWGPCGGQGPYSGAPYPYAATPYAGYYAPPVYAPPTYAPPYPTYGPPPGYAKPWGRGQVQGRGHGGMPWGGDDMYDDDFAGPDGKEMFESDRLEDRNQAKEVGERRATFRARAEAHRAEMKAKRDAWRQQMDQMGPMDRYSGQTLAPETSAITTPEPLPPPVAVPAAPTKTPATPTTKP